MNFDSRGKGLWGALTKAVGAVGNWFSENADLILTAVIVVGVVALTLATAGLAAPIIATSGGLIGSIAAGAAVGAIRGALFSAGFSIVSQGLTNGYNDIDWNQVGKDALFGVVSGAVLGGLGGAARIGTAARQMAYG